MSSFDTASLWTPKGRAGPRYIVLALGLFTPAYLYGLEQYMRRSTRQVSASALPLPPPLEADEPEAIVEVEMAAQIETLQACVLRGREAMCGSRGHMSPKHSNNQKKREGVPTAFKRCKFSPMGEISVFVNPS